MEERSQHSVRIRNDLWEVFISLNISLQDLVENAIVDKAKLNGNLEVEIKMREGEIKHLQELNGKCIQFLQQKVKQDEAHQKEFERRQQEPISVNQKPKMSREDWIMKNKPRLKEHFVNGILSDNNYQNIQEALNLATKEEVEHWLMSGEDKDDQL